MIKNRLIRIFFIISMVYICTFLLLFFIHPFLPESVFLAKHPLDNNILFYIPYGHGLVKPLYLFWVFWGARFLEITWIIFIFLLLMVVFLINYIKNSKTSMFRWLFYSVVVFGFFVMFYYFLRFEIGKSMFLADSKQYPLLIESGVFFASSFLNDKLQIFIHGFFGLSGLETMKYLSIFWGGAFSVVAFWFALLLGKNVLNKIIVFFGIVFSGYSILFFGFPETTGFVITFMALYLLFSLKFLIDREQSILFLILAFVSLSIACLAHNAALTLGLSVLFLCLSNVPKIFSKTSLTRFLLAFFIIVLPFLIIIVWNLYLKGNIGNAGGGGGGIMFVPLQIEYTLNVSRPFYSLFSFFYFSEVVSSLLFTAPMSLIFLIFYFLFSKKFNFKKTQNTLVTFLLLASLGASVIPVFWNMGFGAMGDFNLVSTYFFPFNLAGWVAFTFVINRFEKDTLLKIVAFFALFLQLLFTMGFYSMF